MQMTTWGEDEGGYEVPCASLPQVPQPATLSEKNFETKPATEPKTKPRTKPATMPETGPATKPETGPATKPETGPATKPGRRSRKRGGAVKIGEVTGKKKWVMCSTPGDVDRGGGTSL